ncbi:hypothetical protein N5T26_06530 [Escherichia coli]|uniref:hypothetical protein n=1 Tax=Escherichia coli TaxID=562 RepID=UPI001DE5DEBA|nr:hypothetical protein [Escherichia coli]EIA0771580.1 hypothetical protein [Escherichia coli]MCF7401203.1 hypothetical protein [Escherichia coli]MCW3255226.1 hypothetical protein [Escherichia coli]MED9537148.1 hypothetical protein [Escherichia coli]HAY0420789.1 hypothetical protein [Escherichia coli]
MNDMIVFGNGDTARMNTWEIKEFLDERRPARQKPYEHNKIVKKAEELMAQGVIKGRFKIDIKINQELRGFKTVEGFEFIGEQGERDVIVLVSCFLPAVTGAMWDRWHELLAHCRELEQKVLVLMKNETLAEEAEALKEQMETGTIDTKDAMDKVTIWMGKRKGTGSKAGKALVGQRKLKRMEKELKTLAIGYVQPPLPF